MKNLSKCKGIKEIVGQHGRFIFVEVDGSFWFVEKYDDEYGCFRKFNTIKLLKKESNKNLYKRVIESN